MQVVFDEGPLTGGTLFSAPRALIRADRFEEVEEALARMVQARADGLWLAGFASYELGYWFAPRLRPLAPERRAFPLLCFGAFREPVAAPAPARAAGPARLSDPRPRWDEAAYARAFARVRAYIEAGDAYQINLTFPVDLTAEGAPETLYQALRARQPVRFGAWVDFEGGALLSRSPELFFRTDAEGAIIARPMKGTAPRGATEPEDRALRAALAASEKNRAENLMIVDLLRNDLSRISRIGSVRVPRLFEVESYATLHQMISEVRARLCDGVTLPDIFAALFPCGSITGAPKIRAMEIIRELEPQPREAYCGAIGWAAPDGSSCFNVAIRTLALGPDGGARLDVGGGVVHDSTAGSEYEEALLKARFARLQSPS